MASLHADDNEPLERALPDLLERAVPHLPAPADRIARIHRRATLRRRRLRAGTAVAVVALGSAGAGLTARLTPSPREAALSAAGHSNTPGPNGRTPSHAPASPTPAPVARRPTHRAGFTLRRVPPGWRVIDTEETVLILAPRGTKPDDPSDGISYVNRVIVSLNSEADPTPPAGTTELRAHGIEGLLHTDAPCTSHPARENGPSTTSSAHACTSDETAGDPTKNLWIKQADGTYLTIQVWSGLHWSNDQIARLAADVVVTPAAEQGLG